MNYPLISEYIQSIKFSSENLNKLSNLRPVLDEDDNPVMSSGNFAVVFKMEDRQSGKLYAVKCFLRDQKGRNESYKLITSELENVSSSFLIPIQYIEKELFVDTEQDNDTEFPVLLMDWVEGITMDKYIRNNIYDSYKLFSITYQFCRMGSWLLSQEFAHGDLKPDNIIVREDGQLVMVDYDGMFVPAMRGQKARELGCVDYRHPFRTEDVFDGSIDDFSIASIALSLKAISLKPELLNDFGADDRLLLSAKDYQNIGESECLRAIQSLSNDTELSQLLGLFYIAYGRNELNIVSYKIFNISEPKPVVTSTLESEIQLSTEVTEEDLANAVEDEFGVLYSKDGKRLLKCKDGLKAYSIRTNTNVICDKAFSCCKSLQQIEIPNSVKYIGDFAFLGCVNLPKIIISRTVEIIGKSAFADCFSLTICSYNDRFIIYDKIFFIDKREKILIACLTDLQQITIPDIVTSIGDDAFRECKSLQQITIPNSVTKIGNFAFRFCSSLQQIIMPDSVVSIGNGAFYYCKSLQQIEIPDSVKYVGDFAFYGCKNLHEITIPRSVEAIGKSPFVDCSLLNIFSYNDEFIFYNNIFLIDKKEEKLIACLIDLQQITIPNCITFIGDSAFRECKSLQQITIPDSVTSIGASAFRGCKSLQQILLPDSVTFIGASAFSGCCSLRQIIIPNSVTSIRKYTFNACCSLQQIKLPNAVTTIGALAFCNCTSLQEIEIPNSVTTIEPAAFRFCHSLQQVTIPNSVTTIGNAAFSSCKTLKQIVLPDSLITIGKAMLLGSKSLQSIIVPKYKTDRYKNLLKYSKCDLSIIKEQDD